MFWFIFAIIWLLIGWLVVLYMAWVAAHIEKVKLLSNNLKVEEITGIVTCMIIWPVPLVVTSIIHIQGKKS